MHFRPLLRETSPTSPPSFRDAPIPHALLQTRSPALGLAAAHLPAHPGRGKSEPFQLPGLGRWAAICGRRTRARRNLRARLKGVGKMRKGDGGCAALESCERRPSRPGGSTGRRRRVECALGRSCLVTFAYEITYFVELGFLHFLALILLVGTCS